jgi:hypothetical protein
MLLACLCIGLATTVGTVRNPDEALMVHLDLAEVIPWSIYLAIMATGAAAMTIGLGQQVMVLRRFAREGRHRHAFALTWAITWRVVIAMVLAASLLLLGAVNNAGIRLPEGELSRFSLHRVVPEQLLLGCMVLVLISSLHKSARPTPRPRRTIAVGIAGGLIGMFAVGQATFLTYLVYRALDGIETAQLPQFRRPDAYPDLTADGYRLFWTSLAAVASAVIGGGLLMASSRRRLPLGSPRLLLVTVGTLLLATAAGYGGWFLLLGFPAMSPDFAEAGWASNWWAWCEAGLVLAIAIPAAGYRLCRVSSSTIEIDPTSHPVAIHQTPLLALVLVIGAVTYVVAWGQSNYEFLVRPWPSLARWQGFILVLADDRALIPWAVSLLSLQLMWRHLRMGSETISIRITEVEPWQLMRVSAVLLVIVILSIPTLLAFGFAFWFAPWS